MNRHICIHGHFYQPPRENPWLETVEHQDSAYPFHDWNERITAECYAPNGASRILDHEGYIAKIINNYSRISFNFGPTLLAWMERTRPTVYQAVLDADTESQHLFGGHGSAIAQGYNHSILPLCNRRDKITQIRWGIRDFEHRFGRRPEGIWLPETAVDTETLELLADEGLLFTLLAPHQAGQVRVLSEHHWRDVSGSRVDPKVPYVIHLPSGNQINLFFYDGPVSQAVAFERLLHNGDRFADRLTNAFDNRQSPQLVHIATDGETYGHHHRHGDMALAYALDRIERDSNVNLTNYGDYLDRHPPRHEVKIIERTSWSCAHGVERWRSDCGCNSGMHPRWRQNWRGPLRDALDWLRDSLGRIYESRAKPLLPSPWKARDAYIDVILDRSDTAIQRFFHRYAGRRLNHDQRIEALKLLEMERQALLMYTSCGWFFDEISGIETTQIIRYASRAIQLAEDVSDIALESGFLQRLERAPSNLEEYRNGRVVYERFAQALRVDLHKLVAHYAVSSMFTEYQPKAHIHSYTIERADHWSSTLGRNRLAVGKLKAVSEITRESAELSYGFVHLGDHNMSGGVRAFRDNESYQCMRKDVSDAFSRADMPESLRLLDKHFGELSYSMRSLFRDEQRRILDLVVDSATRDAESLSDQLYTRNSPLLRYLASLDLPLPKSLRGLADFVLNTSITTELQKHELDHERIHSLLREANELGTELDKAGIVFALQNKIIESTERWADAPERLGRLRRLRNAIELARELPFDLDLSQPQTEYYSLISVVLPGFREQAVRGDDVAAEWVEHFHALGKALRIRLPDEPALPLSPVSGGG